ncbi:hypothetical protein HN446_00280 [bacterium]|jgi:uncharacterized protein|nr:hypothetical protein [bacterium]
MTRDPFNSFIKLTLFDAEIVQFGKQIESLEKDLLEAHAKRLQLDVQHREAKQYLHDVQKAVDAKELKMKELDSLEKEERVRLDSVKNKREFDSIQKEIEKISSAQHEEESALMEVWNKLETAKREYKKFEDEFGGNVAKAEEQIKEMEREKKELEKELERKKKDRPELEKNVPEELLGRYAAIQRRTPNPVVPVESESCSACYFNVSKNDLILMKRKRLLQCRDCFRFLYVKNLVDEEGK